ncbi:MAG: tyrosine-type recombinase/integrase [Frankiales bacterium]|nr:tyrosine-type recombinase/integrase [Frankiales bacterium]
MTTTTTTTTGELIAPDAIISGDLTVHGMDDETKVMLGFLARHYGRTLENYELDLRLFKQWATSNGLLNILTAERWQLELYVRHMVTERHLAPATVSRRFGTIRQLYRFAHDDGVIARNPAAGVRMPKVDHEQQYRTWFTSVDMAIVLRFADRPLDRAVLQIMFDLALRVGELCSLDVESIRQTNAGPRVSFIGKGGRLASMLVPPSSVVAIDRYLAGRETGPLFLNAWGNRLSRKNVQAIIDRSCAAARVPYRVTPHGIRRTSCRFGIQQGESLDQAAERLRHVDSRVTKTCYAMQSGMGDIDRLRISALMSNLDR